MSSNIESKDIRKKVLNKNKSMCNTESSQESFI